MVEDKEHFSRWVYNPRFINDSGEVNDKFITLRSHINEKGISGQLYDRLTLEEIITTGLKFIRRKRSGEPTETLSHIAKVQVSSIRQLATTEDKIDIVEVPSETVPQHAEIQFSLKAAKPAKLYYYFEKIKDGMLQDLFPVKQTEGIHEGNAISKKPI